jgi:hypothetical protein
MGVRCAAWLARSLRGVRGALQALPLTAPGCARVALLL